MAARRLLIVMLVLLGISSVIAIVVPGPSENDPGSGSPPVTGTSGETGTTGTTGGTTGATGEERTGPASDGTGPVARETVTLDGSEVTEIEAAPGTRMVLTVRSKDGSEVEVDGLGLTGFADPYAPAVFDVILPEKPGRYAIRAPEEKPDAVIITRS